MADSSPQFLPQAVMLLGAAVVMVPLFNRLKLGSIVGYLAAGVLVGPQVLRLVHDPHLVMSFAELGIVMFLFLIGLEMEPRRVWSLRRDIFGLGSMQMALTGVVVALVPILFGLTWQASLVAGMGFALSSTAIMGQILEENGEMRTEHGQRAFSVAIFQDLAIVPLMAMVALLSPLAQSEASEPVWLVAGKMLGAVLVISAVGVYLLNPLFKALALWGRREVMTAAALLVVMSAAWLMSAAGLSMAMGAFLAGMFLAESNFRHQLEADIEPFRGLLMGLFFMSVGMTLDIYAIPPAWWRILVALIAIIALKVAVLYGLMRFFRHDRDQALRVALVLGQAGEFGFVLFSTAVAAAVMKPIEATISSIIVVLSMALSPFIYRLADLATAKAAEPEPVSDFGDARGEVLMIGFGRFGQLAAQVLLARRIPVTIIDNDIEMIEAAARFGFKIYFGDGTRLDVLNAAGLERARLVAVCVDNKEAALKIVDLVKEHAPLAKVLARAYDRRSSLEMRRRDVDFEIRETAESALRFGRMQLVGLGVDEQAADEIVADVRRRDEERLQLQLAEGLGAGVHLVSGNAAPKVRPTPLQAPARAAKALNAAAEVVLGKRSRRHT